MIKPLLFSVRQKAAFFTAALVLVLAALAVAIILLRAGLRAPPQDSEWLFIEEKPLLVRLGLVGRLEPASFIAFTAPFDGVIEEKGADDGQRVQRGQMLLRLDAAQLDIRLREAQAELLKAKRAAHELAHWPQSQEATRARRTVTTLQTNINDTQRKLDETSALLERGIVPRMELDALKQQMTALRLDLAAAQADLKTVLAKGNGEERQIAEMELANADAKYKALQALEERREIVAPFAGIIMRSAGAAADQSLPHAPLQPGAHVARGQLLFTLANLEQLNVVAKVDEVDVNLLREGQAVEITGDGFDGIVLKGTVASVGAHVAPSDSSASGATYEVVASMPPLNAEEQKRLKLGMSAKLSIMTYRNDAAVVIPPDALQRDGLQLFVEYRDAKESPSRRIDVQAGRTTAGGVEVFGLAPGYVKSKTQP